MLHARRAEDLPLTLPPLLVLKQEAQLNPTAQATWQLPPAPTSSVKGRAGLSWARDHRPAVSPGDH